MRGSSIVLFVCAGLMLSGGTILGGSTAWTLLNVSYYFWTTDLGVELCSGILIIAGALLCLPTCWLATIVPYHPKCSSLLGAMLILMIATMLMLSLGVSSMAGLSHELRDVSRLNSSMMRALMHANFDPAVRSSFAAMQMELKCCGVNSYKDWYQYRASLPASCCGKLWNKQKDSCNLASYNIGCLRPAMLELRRYANSLCVLACAIIIILAVSLFGGVHTLVTAEGVEDRPPKPLGLPMRVACLPHTILHTPQSLIPPVNPQPI